MSDHDRDRGGGCLAVLIVAAVLAVLVLIGGFGALHLFQQATYKRAFAAEQAANAAVAAERRNRIADEAAMNAAAAIETPAPPAPESPPPTQ